MKNVDNYSCKCGCGMCGVDPELLYVLNDIEQAFPYYKLNFNSVCRCTEHNKNVGGVAKSQHLYGKAADIFFTNIDAKIIYDYLDKIYPNKYGMKLYKTFVHIDVREKKWRGKK